MSWTGVVSIFRGQITAFYFSSIHFRRAETFHFSVHHLLETELCRGVLATLSRYLLPPHISLFLFLEKKEREKEREREETAG